MRTRAATGNPTNHRFRAATASKTKSRSNSRARVVRSASHSRQPISRLHDPNSAIRRRYGFSEVNFWNCAPYPDVRARGQPDVLTEYRLNLRCKLTVWRLRTFACFVNE